MKFKLLIFYYIFIIILLLIGSYFFIDKNLIYLNFLYSGYSYSHRLFFSLWYIFSIFNLFVFYFLTLKLISNKIINKKSLFIIILISCILVFSYPAVLSYDIFNYLSTAKVTFFYHENPYLVMPIEFLNDSMLLYTRAANKYALYGPFWILITAISSLFSFGNFLVEMFLLKIIIGFFYLATVYLLYKLSKNLWVTAFFALNPLVVIETLLSSHNDIVMVFFALLSFYLIKDKKQILSAVTIFLSILIKFATILLLPVLIFVFISNLKKRAISWNKIWRYASLSILFIFLLSPLREEMYPWYFIWVLPFIALVKPSSNIKILTFAFTFGLLIYYIPYMYRGTYDYPTNIYKLISIFLPVLTVSIYIVFKYAYFHFFKKN